MWVMISDMRNDLSLTRWRICNVEYTSAVFAAVNHHGDFRNRRMCVCAWIFGVFSVFRRSSDRWVEYFLQN